VSTPTSTPETAAFPPLRRVLLKLSGEALKGPRELGFDFPTVRQVATEVARLLESGVQIALVVGAGNLFRGKEAARCGVDRILADQVGMLGTVMNAMILADALRRMGTGALLQSAVPIPGVAGPFDREIALDALDKGHAVLFAGGTGHPFFTTDTTAALRAAEIGAHALLKATKVDGVFASDPDRNPQAPRYRKLAYTDALTQRLEVMDAAAFSLCMENRIPIVVFNYARPHALERAITGDTAHATFVGAVQTEIVG